MFMVFLLPRDRDDPALPAWRRGCLRSHTTFVVSAVRAMDRPRWRDLRSSMATVTDAALHELMELLDAGHASPTPAQGVPAQVLERALALVPCDAASFAEFERGQRHHLVMQTFPVEDPGDHEPDEAVFWRHFDDCLACSYPERTGDLRAVTTISDFYSARQFHSTGMYVDYFGPLDVEHEAMVSLSAPTGRSRRLVFFRGPGRDFDERDRLLLSLLRPHLDELYQQLEQHRHPTPQLTERQWELLTLVARGHINAEIARLLFLSAGTVRKHLENIFQRLGVSSRTAAAAAAFPAGLQGTPRPAAAGSRYVITRTG